MQFNPRALLVTAVFLVLLWLAINRGFVLLGVALEVLVGWGLWRFAPDDWLRQRPRPSKSS
jgi:hypothetical protein